MGNACCAERDPKKSNLTSTKPKQLIWKYMSKARLKDLNKLYKINLTYKSKGTFGKIYEATSRMNPDYKIAIKIVEKRGMDEDELTNLIREVEILRKVDHMNIVKYIETYDEQDFLYLCMELVEGTDLLQKIISKQKPLTELEASNYMLQVVKALMHCHQNDIIHRDIRPENIMINNQNEVKLIDFGFAVLEKKRKPQLDIAGSPSYISPETLDSNQGKPTDIWSLGVTAYHMLSGQLPFTGKNHVAIFENIKNGQFEMPTFFSENLKDLISKMLVVDPQSRISLFEIIQHPWCNQNAKSFKFTDEDNSEYMKVIENLKNYRGESKLKGACMNLLVKQISSTKIDQLKLKFAQVDKDNSGMIDKSELQEILAKIDFQITEQELDMIFTQLDYSGNNQINYSEFMAAAVDISQFVSAERIASLFATFDIDGDGLITEKNIKKAFTKFGVEVSEQEIAEMMKAHDSDGGKTISLEEFDKIFRDPEYK